MREDLNTYRREFFSIIILAGVVSWAALTVAFFFGNPIRVTRGVISAGYTTQWLVSTILPGAVSAALIAPFFLRNMFMAMKNGVRQSKKAAVLGMCIGLATCVIFPLTATILAGISDGFDQLGGQRVLLVVALVAIVGGLPAMLIGALVGRVMEPVLHKRLHTLKE
jgi:hypothetical protein